MRWAQCKFSPLYSLSDAFSTLCDPIAGPVPGQRYLPLALAATLLTGLALRLLRYLRTPRQGIIAAADTEARPLFNLKSFAHLETAHVPGPPVPGFECGGGGGAQGQF